MPIKLNLISTDLAAELNRAYTRVKNREAKRRSRAANPERTKQVQRAWAQSESGRVSTRAAQKRHDQSHPSRLSHKRTPPEKRIEYQRRHRGVLDSHLVPAVLQAQGHVCAICGSPESGQRTWHADHDHETGLLRGMLCARCNTGLGLLQDSSARLHSAVAYLQQPPSARIIYRDAPLTLSAQERGQLTGRKKKGMVDAHRFPELLAFQGDQCAICDTQVPGKNGWSCDHDHNSGLIRGALCNACNSGIGRFNDSSSLLTTAIAYLKTPPAEQVRRVSQ